MTASNYFKIAFLGATGSGKSTAIRAISDSEAIDTDVDSTDEVRLLKKTTTVAIDYGELKLDDNRKLLLYGLPGQARFEFMFDTISDNLLGIILLVDGLSSPLDGLEDVLSTYSKNLRSLPLVVALNKLEERDESLAEACADLLAKYELIAPVEQIDARNRDDVIEIFDLLTLLVETAAETPN